jgi:gamma-tubulin complex component 5
LDWDSRWSTPSLSPLNSGDLALDEESDEEVEEQLDVAALPVGQQDGPSYAPLFDSKGANAHPPHTYAHRREFEALQEKQYWRDGWKGDGTLVKTVFNMGDASSLGDQSICLVFC